MDWCVIAKRLLKAELSRRGVTYQGLATALQAMKVEETDRSIANKMSRGKFTFAFFIQSMAALGCSHVTLDLTSVLSEVARQAELGTKTPEGH